MSERRPSSTTYVSRRSWVDAARSRLRRPDPAVVRPYGVASLVAAAWAVVIGLVLVTVPVLLVWATAPHGSGSTRSAVQVAAGVWLAAHQVPLTVDGSPLGLTPVGLLVLPVVLLRLSSAWAARMLRPADLGDATLLTGAVAVLHGLLGGVVAGAASGGPVDASPWWAWVWCTVVAAPVAGWTVLREAGLSDDLVVLVPGPLRRVAAPAAAGALTVVAASALLVATSLVARRSDAEAVGERLDLGATGAVALLVACLVYLPNVVGWAAAFCVGPGFAVGEGTSVTVAGVTTGPMPAFPLLAALPSPGTSAPLTWLCLMVPVAAGVVVGLAVVRRAPDELPETTALWAAGAGALGGAGLGVLAWLSGGPLGAQRLSVVGPSPWQTGAAGALELALVAAVTAWALAWRAARTR